MFASALAFARFGGFHFGHGGGGGFISLIVLAAIVGVIAWALTRPSGTQSSPGDSPKS
jgi:hypothetical protein